MAYVTPKTDWVGGNVPGAGDFDRIEGNNKQNHEDITTHEEDTDNPHSVTAAQVTETSTKKILTSTERTKLAGIETAATADQTASEILTAIKTVDGTGTGLDADLLDGKHASDFSLTTHNHSGTYEPVLATDRKRKITVSTSDPSGGSDGDIWIKYV